MSTDHTAPVEGATITLPVGHSRMTLEEFRAEIARRLSLYRPDRYRVTDFDRAEPVLVWAQGEIASDPALLRAVLDGPVGP